MEAPLLGCLYGKIYVRYCWVFVNTQNQDASETVLKHKLILKM
jgi:hypothetical protein